MCFVPKKLFSGALAFVFFLTQIAFAHLPATAVNPDQTLWSERPRPLLKPFLSLPSVSKLIAPSFPKNAPLTVLHIQDVHMNLEAQTSIAKTIEGLLRQGQVDLIALEGAAGPIDLARYRTYRRPEIIRSISRYMLETNEISGPIFAALTTQEALPMIVGIDDPVHYRANVQAFKTSAVVQKEYQQGIAHLQMELAKEKELALNSDLKEITAHIQAYEDGKASLRQHLEYLRTFTPALPASLEGLSNTLRLESEIDFSQADQERRALLNRLAPRLTKEESVGLLRLSLECNFQNQSATKLTASLRQLSLAHGLEWNGYPAFSKYYHYQQQADQLSIPQALQDLSVVQERLTVKFTRNPQEKKWLERSQSLSLVSKLFQFSLTRAEWERLKLVSSREELTRGFPRMADFMEFYRQAEFRDAAMSRNLLRVIEDRHAKRVVLVTGGFHSEGMGRVLKKAGVSPVLFTPTISKLDTENGTQYLDAFLKEKSPLEKLFHGERLFLARPPALGLTNLGSDALTLSDDPHLDLPRFVFSTSEYKVRSDKGKNGASTSHLTNSRTRVTKITRIKMTGGRVLHITRKYISPIRSVRKGLKYLIRIFPLVQIGSIALLLASNSALNAQPPTLPDLTPDISSRLLIENWIFAVAAALIAIYVLVLLPLKIHQSRYSVHGPPSDDILPMWRLADETYTFEGAKELPRVKSVAELKDTIKKAAAVDELIMLKQKFIQAEKLEEYLPFKIYQVPRELKMVDYDNALSAVYDLFAKQSRMGTFESGHWESSFGILEDESTVVHALYFPGKKNPDLFIGHLPSLEVLQRASHAFVFNAARALRPVRPGTRAGEKTAEDEAKMARLNPSELRKKDGYLRMTYLGNHHPWWVVCNPFPIWPPETKRKVSHWPLHATLLRADEGAHQKDISSPDNIEDLLRFLRALNTSAPVSEVQAPRPELAQVVSKIIELITSKGDTFNVIMAPALGPDSSGFRIGMNGWKYPQKEGAPLVGANLKPGAIKSGTSQTQMHVQIFRYFQPIEFASLKFLFKTSGVTVSYFDVHYTTTFFGWHRVTGWRSSLLHTCMKIFPVIQHLFNVKLEVGGFVVEADGLRIFIGDRVSDVPAPYFSNEWGYPEFLGRTIIVDEPMKFWSMDHNQARTFVELTDPKAKVAWLKNQVGSGAMNKTYPLLRQDYEAARSGLAAPWREMEDITDRLQLEYFPAVPVVTPANRSGESVSERWQRSIGKIKTWAVSLRYGILNILRSRFKKEAHQEPHVQGRSFQSQLVLPSKAVMRPGIIPTQRSTNEVYDHLKHTQSLNSEFSVEGPHRIWDGSGSAMDIRRYFTSLRPPDGQNRIVDLPTFITAAYDRPSFKVRFEPSDDMDTIEYVNPRLGYTESQPYRQRGAVPVFPGTPVLTNGYLDAPAYIFRNVFGIQGGVRIIVDTDLPMAEWGGFEGSSMLVGYIAVGASVLSGADLTLGDLYKLCGKIENVELANKTGEQGLLSTFLGGIQHHIWVRNGDDPFPVSIPLLKGSEEEVAKKTAKIGEHIMIAQAGINYIDGKKELSRLSVVINEMWDDFLKYSIRMHPRFTEMVSLTSQWAWALDNGNFRVAVDSIQRYVQIRDEICQEWVSLLLDRADTRDHVMAGLANRIRKRVHDEKDPSYAKYAIIRELLARGREEFRKQSLYSYGRINEIIKEAALWGIAVMPIGAGGPGSNLMVVSSKGEAHLRKFFKAVGLEEFDDEEVKRIMNGSGTIKGFKKMNLGIEPFRVNGFQELGLKLPAGPRPGYYVQDNGSFVPDEQEFVTESTLSNGQYGNGKPLDIPMLDDATLRERAKDLAHLVSQLAGPNSVSAETLRDAGEAPAKLPIDGALRGHVNPLDPAKPSFGACAAHQNFAKYVVEELKNTPHQNHLNEIERAIEELEKQGLETTDELERVLASLPLDTSLVVVPVYDERTKSIAIKTIEKSTPLQRILILGAPALLKDCEQLAQLAGAGKYVETLLLNNLLFSDQKDTFITRHFEGSLPSEYRGRIAEMSVVLDQAMHIDMEGIDPTSTFARNVSRLIFLFFNDDGTKASLAEGWRFLTIKNLTRTMRDA